LQLSKWTAQDVATLHVVFTSIRGGEVSIEDEFPPRRVSADEIPAAADAA
jgi:hypothetical protein